MPKTEEKVEIKVKVKTKTAPEPKERKDKSKSSSKLPKLITNLLSKKTELKKISPEIDDHMDKNLPCFHVCYQSKPAFFSLAKPIFCIYGFLVMSRIEKTQFPNPDPGTFSKYPRNTVKSAIFDIFFD